MTNEQAIQLLHRLQDEQFDGIHGDERREALSMAVRALEGDGDTIYRQDVLKILSSKNAAWDAYDKVKQLPSVQPVNYGATKSDSSSQLKLNNDLISRKQVLNASHFVACWDGVEHFSLEVVDADFIQKLPSVQPTQTNAQPTQFNALDCVSRQQAIDGIKKEILERDGQFYKGLLVANHVIVHLPPAQPQWIPSSEGKPKRDGKYIVTTPRWKIVDVREYSVKYWWEDGTPLAWMPLPKPYGGESE